jgi:hypothetical protein
MLSLNEVDRVVDKAAAAAFKRRRLSRVYGEPTVDSVEADALRVMIVFKDDTYPEIKGEDATKAVARIFEDLSKWGMIESRSSNSRPRKSCGRMAILNSKHLIEQAEKLIAAPPSQVVPGRAIFNTPL